MRKLAFAAILISLVLPWNAFAQGEYQAVIFNPDLTKFPIVSVNVDAHAPDGTFLHGLDPTQVQIIEDGKSIPVTDLSELRLAVQISVVINTSPVFALRNGMGVPRYEYVKQYIETWARSQRANTIDDLNLLTNGVINQTHLKDSLAFQSAFATFQPDLKQSVPSLDPLSTAIQIALESQQDPPIEKAIFYFAPLPGEEMTETVRLDLITRAKQARARLFVWMVASQHQFDDPEAASLRSLAEETGGQFFAFSGVEPFSEAQSLIEPLRFIYQFQYRSSIHEAGNHQIAVRVDLPDSIVSSAPIPFPITLSAPNPIFVGVPSTILRSAPEKSKDPIRELSPVHQILEILIEYPDGYPRNIKASRLLVDGAVAAENNQAPFNRFTWDLTGYTESEKHSLQAEITDELGFTQTSVVLPVDIRVDLPNQTAWVEFLAGGGVYPLLAVVFILGVLAAIGITNLREKGTIFPRTKGKPESGKIVGSIQDADEDNPDDQLISAGKPEPAFQASLQLLGKNMKSVGDPPILLDKGQIHFGSDRQKASIWIEDDTLEGLHCTISLREDGSYAITDHHSVLGTWLNFTAISTEPVLLQHGDVIQVGDVAYRYQENPPRRTGTVEVKPYQVGE